VRDDFSLLQCASHGFSQVVSLELGTLLQSFDLFVGACIRDRDGGVIGEDAKPAEVLDFQPLAAEKGDDAEHLTTKRERLAGEAFDLLGLGPVGLQKPVARSPLNEKRRVRGSDATDLPVAQGDSLVRPVGACPTNQRIHEGRPDARPQLEIRL
jgi:hypothetical protein